MSLDDPIIEEIYEFRAEHAAMFNHDVRAIVRDFIRQQEEAKAQGKKFVKTPAKLCKPGLRYTSIEEEVPIIVPPIDALPLAPVTSSSAQPR
ncbi:MAG: hypothetical protein WD851_20240 [Pirellulales bacterium]